MRQSSSSISSSEHMRPVRRNRRERYRRHILGTLLWTISALVLVDVSVGFAFRTTPDPRIEPSSLQRYFDYGRTIEGKLRNFIGASPEQDAAIMKAGWLAGECDIATPTPSGKVGIDIYGMSFSNHIAEHMERLDPGLAIHRFAGPGAPPNHSYTCYNRRVEAGRPRATVQIIGILASSIRQMVTVGGLTTSFEAPQPFTYPRYSLNSSGKLVSYSPTITTQNELRDALSDPAKWSAYIEDLAANDAFYVERIFKEDIFDQSVLARMMRRAWAQHVMRERTAVLGGNEGLSRSPDIGPVLRAMLLDFAKKARQSGERPVVILIENRGYEGTLSSIAASTLRENHIEYVTTSSVVSLEDASNFLADGHFTPAADEKIARAVLGLLGRKF